MALELVTLPTSSNTMAAWSDATFLLPAQPLADCEYPHRSISSPQLIVCPSFAFVEYESRRDADDAYHEMHNKRIGRDDVLKIEVSQDFYNSLFVHSDSFAVGSYSSLCLLEIRHRP
jgi:hypothetical protein